jgi:hypothetical protein
LRAGFQRRVEDGLSASDGRNDHLLERCDREINRRCCVEYAINSCLSLARDSSFSSEEDTNLERLHQMLRRFSYLELRRS